MKKLTVPTFSDGKVSFWRFNRRFDKPPFFEMKGSGMNQLFPVEHADPGGQKFTSAR